MELPLAVHFACSHLHWLTRGEGSHGRFQIDSLVDWSPDLSEQPSQFVLAAAVPAGRMYSLDGPLLKQPPYSFQVIAGRQEHKILRRPLDLSQPAVPADSSQPHNHAFESLTWNLSYSEAQPLSPDQLSAFAAPFPILNLLLEFRNHNGLFRLQAPLRHWNHRAEPAGWQIETGPLLWPLDLEAFAEAPSAAALTTAWLHANQAGRATISGDRLPCHELEARLSLLELK